MSEPTIDKYPQDGFDWVDPSALAREAVWSEAGTEELFTHKTAEVRRQFFRKMLAHGALESGYGWAIFLDEPDGSIAEIGSREVLLRSAINLDSEGVQSVPVIRIITNEEILSEDAKTYLSEDITIMPGGETAYHMSTIQLQDNNPELNRETLQTSSSPLFLVVDGELAIAGSVPDFTPSEIVDCDLDQTVTVMPYGDPMSPSQQFYALDKAAGILKSIVNLAPMWQREK